jgi:hypothetical protein
MQRSKQASKRFAAFQSPFHPAYLKGYLSTIGSFASPLRGAQN